VGLEDIADAAMLAIALEEASGVKAAGVRRSPDQNNT
jgi:hypothetical protein